MPPRRHPRSWLAGRLRSAAGAVQRLAGQVEPTGHLPRRPPRGRADGRATPLREPPGTGWTSSPPTPPVCCATWTSTAPRPRPAVRATTTSRTARRRPPGPGDGTVRWRTSRPVATRRIDPARPPGSAGRSAGTDGCAPAAPVAGSAAPPAPAGPPRSPRPVPGWSCPAGHRYAGATAYRAPSPRRAASSPMDGTGRAGIHATRR